MQGVRKVNLALYARVSTLDKGQNPEVQLAEMREWCGRQKHKAVAEYVDHGISGVKASRPQLNKLMHDLRKGLRDIDAVLVWKLDRWGRSVKHLVQSVAELKDLGVGFISLTDGFDLTTPVGTLVFNMLASVAQFERDIIAERTRAGMKHARSQGRLPGRKIDPKRGPCRMTLWRRQQRAKSA